MDQGLAKPVVKLTTLNRYFSDGTGACAFCAASGIDAIDAASMKASHLDRTAIDIETLCIMVWAITPTQRSNRKNVQ
jgi:hypothetical protein